MITYSDEVSPSPKELISAFKYQVVMLSAVFVINKSYSLSNE